MGQNRELLLVYWVKIVIDHTVMCITGNKLDDQLFFDAALFKIVYIMYA